MTDHSDDRADGTTAASNIDRRFAALNRVRYSLPGSGLPNGQMPRDGFDRLRPAFVIKARERSLDARIADAIADGRCRETRPFTLSWVNGRVAWAHPHVPSQTPLRYPHTLEWAARRHPAARAPSPDFGEGVLKQYYGQQLSTARRLAQYAANPDAVLDQLSRSSSLPFFPPPATTNKETDMDNDDILTRNTTAVTAAEALLLALRDGARPPLDSKGVARPRYPGWTDFKLVPLSERSDIPSNSWTILEVFEQAEVVLLGFKRDDYVASVCAERDEALEAAKAARAKTRVAEQQHTKLQTDLAVAEDRVGAADRERRRVAEIAQVDRQLLRRFEEDFATLRKELGDERLRAVLGRVEPPKREVPETTGDPRGSNRDIADLL